MRRGEIEHREDGLVGALRPSVDRGARALADSREGIDRGPGTLEYVLRRDTEQADRMRSFLGVGPAWLAFWEILRSARQSKTHVLLSLVRCRNGRNCLTSSKFRLASMRLSTCLTCSERRATNERGWEWHAFGPVQEIRSRGLADEQIIDELFLIEITAWEMLKGDSGKIYDEDEC